MATASEYPQQPVLHGAAGSYAGTFRWFTQTEFQALPEWQNEAVDLTSGWDSYISSRWHDGMSDSDDDSGSEGNGADDSDSDGDAKARGVGGGAEGGSDGEAGGKKGAKGEAVQKEEAKKHVIDISTVDGEEPPNCSCRACHHLPISPPGAVAAPLPPMSPASHSRLYATSI